MKYCVDCKHYSTIGAISMCGVPVREDMVLGMIGDQCSVARRPGGRCGEDAINFEVKKASAKKASAK